MTRRLRLPVLALGVLVHVAIAAEPLSPTRQREILRDALYAYDQAVGVARDDPARAVELYRQAAAGFQALRDAGVQNAALEYNLGNVCFRLGDVGRAIVHYRRAVAYAPRDERLAANLRYAREQVEPRIPASGEARLARNLLFWHYETPPAYRFAALLVLSILGWTLALVGLRMQKRPLLVSGLVAAALGLASGISLHWQYYDEARHPHAVVVGSLTQLRLGRGEGTDLALKQPLGPGVELRVLQQVGDWVEVRLPNDQTGWLPATSIERV